MITVRLGPPWSSPAVLTGLVGGTTALAEPDPEGAVAIGLADAEARRLDFCLSVLGMERIAATSGDGAYWAYVAGPGAPDVADWDAAFAAEMATEVASFYGGSPAQAARLVPSIIARALARMRGREAPARAELRMQRTPADVESVSVRRPYAGFLAIEEHRLRYRRFDATMSEALARTVMTSGDAVTVLPYDARRDRVLLIEQFRPGPHARRDPLPWCLETVAGRCDVDESLEATARREAQEEAGLALGRLERIAGYYPSPGTAAEHITAFVGEAELDGGEGVFGCADEHEDIRTLVVPRTQAQAAVATGEINNAPLILSLLWLELSADRLRSAWGGPA